MPLPVTKTDERSIQVPIPAGRMDTAEVGEFLKAAAAEDYKLTGAHTIQGGDQRDPYTIGLKLTVSRP